MHCAFIRSRAGEDGVVRVGAQCTEAQRVLDGVNVVDESEVGKVVDVNFPLEHNDDAVTTQLDRLDVAPEAELADASVLMVVPDHHLGGRVARVLTAAHECKDIAAEEHLDDADAARAEVTPEGLLERVAVVDAEPGVGAAREAAVVLVEPNVEELVGVFQAVLEVE